jgi:transposase
MATTLFGMFPFLKTLFADSGYQGPKVAKALAKILPHLGIEIVKRSHQVRGFVVLPKRWIVERTIAWLIAAEGLPRIERISTEKRSRSCASPQYASCPENSAIRPEVSGRTLSRRHHYGTKTRCS